MSKKTWLTGGMTALLSLGLLVGCGDGVDQDNGISDGEKKDAIDPGTKENLNDNGVGDGVDQDNGVSDGENKDAVDSPNP
ncbi:hypothetical protein V7124_01910 [Neobacillus niacini]|uniref:hypothetical protein n=1 Tax=Neobacillus niacini TaxID=86668 RepID=UPI002FFFF047